LNIDHHISNDNFAEHNVVDPRAPSTTQVIAHFLLAEGVDFDGKVAEMLYLGIMTDSGRFAYDSTSLETIKIVEVLMEKGVSISEMYRKVYERDSLARYRLLERFLHNMTVFGNGCCCTSFLEEKDFVETRTGPLDCEGFVNYTRQIDGVNGGAFLEFRNSYTKCSLRARDEKLRMDVFANQFGGGGHPAAAGFTIEARGPDFYEEFGRAFAEHVRKILPQLQP
jgi:phosphoesterase RecJ-like protein